MSLYDFDLTAFRLINQDLRTPLLTPIFMVLSFLGLGGTQAAISFLFLKSKSTRAFVFPMILTIIISGLAVAQVLKKFIPRDRPSNMLAAIREEEWLGNSFPSGHTSTSFACGVMIFLLTRNTRYAWTGPLAILVAALIGVSRVYRGVHWPTDVLAGACGGIFSSCLIYLTLQKRGYRFHAENAS